MNPLQFTAPREAARSFQRRTLRRRLIIEALESRWVPASTAYLTTNLVSDQAGVAAITDANLVNGWGVALNPNAGGFWVSSNGKDLSTIYVGDVNGSALTKAGLEVSIPNGAPTGVVFNNTSDFTISGGGNIAAATFIFASETGDVTGWNINVPPPSPSTSAQLGYHALDGAIYKGIALANNGSGNFLYLADFHNNKIDVLNGTFTKVLLTGNFTDPNLPAGFAPFNVAAINGKLFVAYAKQDATAEDEIAGAGLGFIDVFDLNGNFQSRLVSQGDLNAPWAMVMAPANFGDFSGDLLVGNFGDGKIHAYNATTGTEAGTLSAAPGHPVVVDGLWGMTFGNGTTAGDTNTLYFAAGPGDESHGLFGKITANAPGTNPVQAVLTNGNLIVTGSPDNDDIKVKLDKSEAQLVVTAHGKTVGSFNLADVGIISVDGLAGNDRIQIMPQITVATVLNGGAGNDMIIGGSGNNVLVGGTGDDKLFGSSGRDILIGGDGKDQLQGRANDDLLISGFTTFDDDQASLVQILNEWSSNDTYAVRVAKLRNGTDGLPILNATTVTDDGASDKLFGGSSLDWFFVGNNDKVVGKLSAELTN